MLSKEKLSKNILTSESQNETEVYKDQPNDNVHIM